MPRRSAAELSVIPGLRRIDRLRPPKDLSTAQAAHFAHLVASKPAGFFQPVDLPLLVQLVRHLARADEIDRQFRQQKNLSIGDFDALARLADRESKLIASLLTKLRATPQARYRADSGKHFNDGPRGIEALTLETDTDGT